MMQQISQYCQIKQQQCSGALQSFSSSFFLIIEHTHKIVSLGFLNMLFARQANDLKAHLVQSTIQLYAQYPKPTEPASPIANIILGKAA